MVRSVGPHKLLQTRQLSFTPARHQRSYLPCSVTMALTMPPLAHKLTWVLHACALALALSIAAVFFDKSLFSWHPTLMALGYLLFICEGIVSAIWFRHVVGESRVSAIYKHSALVWPGIICIAFGFYAIYKNKTERGKDHFTTLHGKCGLVALLMTVGAPIGGAIAFRKFGLLTLFPAAVQPMIKMAHKNAGTLVLLLSLATIELALFYPHMNKGVLTPVWQAGVALLGVLVLALMAVAQPQSDKFKAQ